MPVTKVGATTNTGNATEATSRAPAVPAGSAANDVAVVYLDIWNAADPVVTPPTGFTQLYKFTPATGTGVKCYAFWKRLTASDTGTYSFTYTASMWSNSSCSLWRGVKTSGTPGIYSTADASASTFPAVTVNPGHAATLLWHGYNDTGGTHTPPTAPSGFTETVDVDCATDAHLITSSGTSFTVSGATTASSSPLTASVFALEPADAGGGNVTATGVPALLRLVSPGGSASAPAAGNATGTPATMRFGGGVGSAFGGVIATGSPAVLSVRAGSGAATATASVPGSPAYLRWSAGSGTATSVNYRYIVESDGRIFRDQFGDPILVKGDSPWGAPTKMSTAEWSTYCVDRSGRGFNAALFSLVGCGIIGSNDNGATYDGVLPFTGGNVATPNETYWSRMDTFLDIAEANGITVFAYPIDGWTVLGGRVFDGVSAGTCQTFGAWLADRWADRPNLVWMFGGDYSGGFADNQMGGCLAGIRSTGDTHLASCQMNYQRTWTGQYSYWKSRADFWHVYSYPVQYDAVFAAYNDAGDESTIVPSLFMEGHYGGENDGSIALTIRKQAAWAMTQGSPGHFYGSDDWDLFSGWAGRLGNYSVADVSRVHTIVEDVDWWKLQPSRSFLTSGAGTLLDASSVGTTSDSSKDPSQSSYATAAVAADGSLALVYLPAQRAIQVNTALLGASPVGTWVNTATLAETAAGSLASTVTPPSSGDWFLRVEAAPAAPVVGVGSASAVKVFGGLGAATAAASVAGQGGRLVVGGVAGGAVGGASVPGVAAGSPAALWVAAAAGAGVTGAVAVGVSARALVGAASGVAVAAANVSGAAARSRSDARGGLGLVVPDAGPIPSRTVTAILRENGRYSADLRSR